MGGGGSYNRMCSFTRGRACNWATTFPGCFSQGKSALGTRLRLMGGPITGQPRSQGPLLPVPVKQNVLCVSPGPETGVFDGEQACMLSLIHDQ